MSGTKRPYVVGGTSTAAQSGSGGGSPSGGFGGGGGDGYDPGMEALIARVDRLDNAFSEMRDTLVRMDLSLATISERLSHTATRAGVESVRTEVATLSGKVDAKAEKVDVANLQGRVGRIPTAPTLLAIAALATVVAANWQWVLRHL